MSMFEVIAAPAFSKSDGAWLEDMRKLWAHSLGRPHFTLVFPGNAIAQGDFIRLIETAVAGTKRISICLRSAIVVPDAQVNAHHVFLVPDEGFGAVVRLHGRLHRAAIKASLQPHLTYLPHLTVASMDRTVDAERVADGLNAKDFAIWGQINEVVVHRRDGEVIRTVATVPLIKPGLFGS